MSTGGIALTIAGWLTAGTIISLFIGRVIAAANARENVRDELTHGDCPFIPAGFSLPSGSFARGASEVGAAGGFVDHVHDEDIV